ncbi:MAG: glutathione S-transferase family protein, partial [Gammaproteobacteria bacterium]
LPRGAAAVSARMPEIVLYASIASRSLTAFWMFEELGANVVYRWQDTDIKARKHKSPEYVAINPTGRVPAITVDGVLISERPAICMYLADRFSYGVLAPKMEAPERGTYLRWMVYATAALDPAITLKAHGVEQQVAFAPFNRLDAVVAEIGAALAAKQWLLGDRFTAADVVLGSILAMAHYNKQLPANVEVRAYLARLNTRPALQRAIATTFPPHVIEEARRREA